MLSCRSLVEGCLDFDAAAMLDIFGSCQSRLAVCRLKTADLCCGVGILITAPHLSLKSPHQVGIEKRQGH